MLVADEEPVVGVPAIVVAEPVDVRVPARIVATHVRDRDAMLLGPTLKPLQHGPLFLE